MNAETSRRCSIVWPSARPFAVIGCSIGEVPAIFIGNALGLGKRNHDCVVSLIATPMPRRGRIITELHGTPVTRTVGLLLATALLFGACASRQPSPDRQPIPARAANALTGSAFIASVVSLSRDQREAAILRELLSGNIPQFLRVLQSVEVSATGADGIKRTIVYEVMPDYLAIGSDDDFVRMPMNPYTAQSFCDAFGFVLPTRKMVNDIWAAAPVHLDPRPLTQERESPLTFLQHHRIIEEQLTGIVRGTFVAGIKKDVVISNRLLERPERVAIYGWHYPDGRPIQPLYPGHVDWYVDYSHGIRPVRRWMRIDGVMRVYEEILSDFLQLGLLSDEGEISARRYQK